ncbi:WD domain, G-beta repeat protein [Ancylostoma caninum]|uniref:WD domain, G-beta repeat protein n=1 Tax=Ancylostoma caninum TaxID=29170 RepID=A0A368GNJ4_ANCCA|nr:WD domain, G-beta repeat protein [Ancylostoma caninum]
MMSVLENRELFGASSERYRLVNEDRLVQRLGNTRTISAHEACVNTLRWNRGGTLLASGSDDRRVKVWNLAGECIASVETGHHANVFAVEFLPAGNDRILVSAAGDRLVKMHDLDGFNGKRLLASGSDDRRVKVWNLAGECIASVETGHHANVFAVEFLPAGNDRILVSAAGDRLVKMHDLDGFNDEPITWTTNGRVKRLATAQDEPYLFWSASEDCYVREYDTRTNEDRKLINTEEKRVKSFAICQGRTELVAVATDEAPVPIYDRRKADKPLLTCVNADDKCHGNFTYTTHVSFDEMGTECLVNQGCGPIYLFKLKSDDRPTVLQKIKQIIENNDDVPANGKHTLAFADAREQAKEFFSSKKFPEVFCH